MSDNTEAVLQIIKTWKPPLGWRDVPQNGSLLTQTVEKRFGNVWSHKNLDAAVTLLGDQISYERGYVPSGVAQVWSEWWNNYAPKNVQRSAANQAAIKAYLDKFFNGLVTIQNLNLAQPNLSLALVPEQTAQEHANLLAEKAAKAEAQQLKRIQKEQLENSEAAFFERAKAAETAKNLEKEEKRQDDAGLWHRFVGFDLRPRKVCGSLQRRNEKRSSAVDLPGCHSRGTRQPRTESSHQGIHRGKYRLATCA